jgi:hypothetical protein
MVCGKVHDDAEASHSLRLLRPRRQRPRRRRAAEEGEERAAVVAVDTVITVNGIFD